MEVPCRRPSSASSTPCAAKSTAGHIGARGVDKAFATLSDLLASTFAARLSVLERRTANISQAAAALNRSLRTLSEANDALGAGASEAGDLSNLYLDPPSQRVERSERPRRAGRPARQRWRPLAHRQCRAPARRVRPAREQPRLAAVSVGRRCRCRRRLTALRLDRGPAHRRARRLGQPARSSFRWSACSPRG